MKITLIQRYCAYCGAPFKVLKESSQIYNNRLCEELGRRKNDPKKKKHSWQLDIESETLKKRSKK